MKNALVFPLCAVVLVFSSTVAAEVYRCTDPVTKKVTYSGTPCVKGDERKVSITDNAIMNGAATKRSAVSPDAGGNGGDGSQSPIAIQPAGSSPEDQAARTRLADECARGFKRSCSTLRLMNTADPSSASQSATASPEAKRLAQECERGYKKSCDAYRVLTGEQERKKTVCNTSGVSSGYATRTGPNTAVGSGVYTGRTICRERPDD
jgi:hypothetical protein